MQVEREPMRDGVARLVLSGEIDMLSAGEVSAAGAAGLAEAGCEAIDVDLSGVTFLDSSGIGALVAIRTEARNTSKQLRVVGATDRVRQVIEVCGLTAEFGMAPADRASTPWSTR